MSDNQNNNTTGGGHVPALTMFFFAATVLLAILQYRSCDQHDTDQDKIGLYEQSQAQLKTYKDKDSLNHGQIDLLYGKISSFKGLRAKDSSEIARLKKIVDKNTISATIMTTSTANTVTGHTTVTFSGNPGTNSANNGTNSGIHITPGIMGDIETQPGIDSTRFPCDTACFPIYSTTYSNKWENVAVVANKDSIQVKYKVFNDFSIVQKFEKRGKWPFRKDIPIIDVTNNNPHTETISLRSFAVEPPKPQRGRWFVIGAAAGLTAGFLLMK